MSDSLLDIHKIELEILDVIVGICEKHELTYFLAYGSCLGAVRHAGFIPWDDDIDIGMPRKDYNRFVDICKTDLPEEYYYQGIENEKAYWLSFGKVRKKGTYFIEKYVKGQLSEEKQGIYIDIFPYEIVNDLCERTLKIDSFIRKLRVMLFLKVQPYHDSNTSFVKYCVARLIPSKFIKALLVSLIQCLQDHNGKLLVSVAQPYPIQSGILQLQGGVLPLTNILFEGKSYLIPTEYDAYLTSLYGDYLTPPPPEKRISHQQITILFPNKDD